MRPLSPRLSVPPNFDLNNVNDRQVSRAYATAYVYAGADTETLSEIARFCNRLILTAMQAEQIDDGGGA